MEINSEMTIKRHQSLVIGAYLTLSKCEKCCLLRYYIA